MAVTRVTIHHEGAGTPTDQARGAAGGYTYWIGTTHWTRLRSVSTSFATLHYNHVSVDLCISGDRTSIPVTNTEIRLIGEAVADARSRGEVVDAPAVYPHRQSFLTACPGDQTIARFAEIVNVCQKSQPPPPVDWDALIRLDQWRHRVSAMPLVYGGRGPDVLYLNGLLRDHHYLAHDVVIGDKYGWRTRRGVYVFKLENHVGNTDGKTFGGTAADVMVSLG